MMTLRLGVDGSLTPWAQAPAGLTSAIAIKTKRFITMSPERKRRGVGHRSFTVPWVTYRGTATSLPSLQTPWAAVPGGKLPVLRFRIAVGREAALWIASAFFVVTMLLLVVLAGSFTPCAKAGCARETETRRTAENARIVEHRQERALRNVAGFGAKASHLGGPLGTAALPRHSKCLAKRCFPGYLIGLDDRPRQYR
jgi:hypothetical protein